MKAPHIPPGTAERQSPGLILLSRMSIPLLTPNGHLGNFTFVMQERICDDSLAAQLLLRLAVTVTDPGFSGSPISSRSCHRGFRYCQPSSRRHGGWRHPSSFGPQDCPGMLTPIYYVILTIPILASARERADCGVSCSFLLVAYITVS